MSQWNEEEGSPSQRSRSMAPSPTSHSDRTKAEAEDTKPYVWQKAAVRIDCGLSQRLLLFPGEECGGGDLLCTATNLFGGSQVKVVVFRRLIEETVSALLTAEEA
ncbi:hypothetical protein ACLB2K_004160 [Fragaria x ananassa]